MSKIVRLIKNVANGYSATQILVRKATSNDPLGPSTYDMEEIAAATYNTQTEFLEIMDMLDRRLNDKGKNWRHVAKSLTVLDYLVRFGLDKCVLWAKDNLYIIKTLREFVHFDEINSDQGALIRVKAKELVALLQNDERLAAERKNARREPGRRQRLRAAASDPYDADLQRALEMSRETAERENERERSDDDAELQAALKLSLEEEEMRRRKQAENENLLDLSEPAQGQTQQYALYFQTGQAQDPFQQYAQPQYFPNQGQTGQFAGQFQTGQFPQYQTGQFQTGQFPQYQTGQFQTGQFPQYQSLFPQYQAGQFAGQNGFPDQAPQFTGFAGEELRPLKTGSNNPFALDHTPQPQPQLQQLQQPSLAELASEQKLQPAFYTQPQQPGRKYNDSHELNTLLATGTGVDTFGNTGATRIPHQHTKTGTFINSMGTGIRPQTGDVRMSSNATGNPFLNTGIGTSAPQRIEPAATGYGFGNSKDEPSLIDI